MHTYYLVTADHVSPAFACTNRRFRVSVAYAQNSVGGARFSASARRYGCSKDYSTPERAIRGMLEEHACTNVRITLDTDQNTWGI